MKAIVATSDLNDTSLLVFYCFPFVAVGSDLSPSKPPSYTCHDPDGFGISSVALFASQGIIASEAFRTFRVER